MVPKGRQFVEMLDSEWRAGAALAALRSHPLGRGAAILGEVREEPAGMVFLRTVSGGTRVVDMLAGEQLPRIR